MALLAAPSGGDILLACAVIITIAVVLTFSITRDLAPRWGKVCDRRPQLRHDFADSDSKWLQAGMLTVSGAIAAGAVSGLLTAIGNPPIWIAWVFCWFGGIALARFLVGARAAGILSGLAMGGWTLASTLHEYFQDPVRRLNPASDVYCIGVMVFALAFGFGYALSMFTGGIHRSARWLWRRVGRRIPQ